MIRINPSPAPEAEAEGAGAPEIEVTDEMVEAAQHYWQSLGLSDELGMDPSAHLLGSIFAVMWEKLPIPADTRASLSLPTRSSSASRNLVVSVST